MFFLFEYFIVIRFFSKVLNMVELYFRIIEDIVVLLIFYFYFVVVCYMLIIEFLFFEIGKIYLFLLKGEICLVIIFCFLFIYIEG